MSRTRCGSHSVSYQVAGPLEIRTKLTSQALAAVDRLTVSCIAWSESWPDGLWLGNRWDVGLLCLFDVSDD